jgi:hypothetical protein
MSALGRSDLVPDAARDGLRRSKNLPSSLFDVNVSPRRAAPVGNEGHTTPLRLEIVRNSYGLQGFPENVVTLLMEGTRHSTRIVTKPRGEIVIIGAIEGVRIPCRLI